MARKRKDQRFGVDSTIEQQVFSLLGGQGKQAQALIELREALTTQVERVSEALEDISTELLAQTLALGTGRRGEARFEVDPDGKLVLVVSYGGEALDPLNRGDLKPAWIKRNERKPRQSVEQPEIEPPVALKPQPEIEPPKPTKKKGFMKTSPALSKPTPVTPVTSSMDDLDDLLVGFGEDELTETVSAEVPETYTPPARSRLRRIPGQKITKATKSKGNGKGSLSSLLSLDKENED